MTLNDIFDSETDQYKGRIFNINGNGELFDTVLHELSHLVKYSWVTSYALYIAVAGGKEELGQVFKVLRSHGLTTDYRPQEGDPSYEGTFTKVEPLKQDTHYLGRVHVSFTSTKCKRTQVGTKTVMEPIYEIRCEE